MYELLKTIAQDNDWIFDYGRKDYLNLNDDMETDKIYLFAEPIEISSKFSDSGNEQKTYSGKLMILVSSDLDETYLQKYENHIQPLIQNAGDILKNAMVCDEYEILNFKSMEVINLFDYNVDGVLITYSVNEPY